MKLDTHDVVAPPRLLPAFPTVEDGVQEVYDTFALVQPFEVRVSPFLEIVADAGGFKDPVNDENPMPPPREQGGDVGERHRSADAAFERVEGHDVRHKPVAA